MYYVYYNMCIMMMMVVIVVLVCTYWYVCNVIYGGIMVHGIVPVIDCLSFRALILSQAVQHFKESIAVFRICKQCININFLLHTRSIQRKRKRKRWKFIERNISIILQIDSSMFHFLFAIICHHLPIQIDMDLAIPSTMYILLGCSYFLHMNNFQRFFSFLYFYVRLVECMYGCMCAKGD